MLYTVASILHLVLFLIAAFEILTSSKDFVKKVLWLFLIFFLPLLGLILYYLLGRGK